MLGYEKKAIEHTDNKLSKMQSKILTACTVLFEVVLVVRQIRNPLFS